MSFSKIADQFSYPFSLPVLPFLKSDLSPQMSEQTFSFHYDKHHNAYVTNLNNLLKDNAEFAGKTLEQVIILTANKEDKIAIFNNAAQVWNHTFFWHSMKKDGGGKPSGKILDQIESSFGSFEKFVEQFKSTGVSQFGSGWVWLVQDVSSKSLKVVKTSNAGCPITSNLRPLITCDVWEHAYYIDYQNRRPDFISVFLEKLVSWSFAESNLV